MSSDCKPRLIAFELHPQDDMPIEPAPSDREWMDRSANRYAYRCLPLVIANQAGWIIRCPADFSVRWNGGPLVADLKVRLPRGSQEARISSHFGEGVLTFSLPYLFRTPPGVNLWVKGPTNCIKDGVQPLEGVVETDWNESTFTMNWKVTRKNHTIRFEREEPICMIVPVARGLAESLEPVRQPVQANPKLAQAFEKWRDSRTGFNEGLARHDDVTVKSGWQRDYMLGMNTDGVAFAEHQTRLQLGRFQRED